MHPWMNDVSDGCLATGEFVQFGMNISTMVAFNAIPSFMCPEMFQKHRNIRSEAKIRIEKRLENFATGFKPGNFWSIWRGCKQTSSKNS